METNPLVSIVTPSYNKGRFIEETILSVKNQTYPHIEHIVIDGGSTDGTLDILRKYSNNPIWISEPDRGQSDAVNKGWKMAKGEILAYLNADDTYMPWAVETAVKYLVEHPDVDMIYGKCNLINEDGMVTGQYPYLSAESDLAKLICSPFIIPQPTVFFKRQVLDTTGYLDTDLHMAMDYDLWIRIGLKCKIEYIPEVLANFRVCPGTKTVDQTYKFLDDHSRILNALFSDPELPQEVKNLKWWAYSHLHVLSGSYYYSSGQRQKARKHFLKALIWHPVGLFKDRLILFYLFRSFFGAKATKAIMDCRRKSIIR